MGKTFLSLSLILAVAIGSIAAAQKGEGRHHKNGPENGPQMMHPGFFNDAFLKKIGVNDENRTKIKAIMKELRNEMLAGFKEMKEKRLALRDEMIKPELDETKIKALYNEIAELQKKRHLSAEYKKLEIAKLLTQEQRKKIAEIVTKRHQEFSKKMRGHMMEE